MFEQVSFDDVREETYDPWDAVNDSLDNEDDNDSAEE